MPNLPLHYSFDFCYVQTSMDKTNKLLSKMLSSIAYLYTTLLVIKNSKIIMMYLYWTHSINPSKPSRIAI